MRTVGFIGLGIMGAPMAANLVRAGFDVIGYNRSRSKVDAFVAAGGRGASTVAEAARGADVVITMLPDSPDVRAVVLDEGGALDGGGVLANLSAGALLIDCSTIRPDVAREVADAGGAAGVGVLDAPVSGGEKGAIDGALSIMVGGGQRDFARAQPVFDVIGGTVVHVGPAGAGQTVKAANQLMVAGNIQLVAEALVFLEAQGVHTDSAIQVLSGGLAGSKALDAKAANMTSRSFTPGFRAELHHKDLGILQAAAREAGVPLPLGAAVAQLMSALVAQGHGGLDHSALVTLVEQLAGRDQVEE